MAKGKAKRATCEQCFFHQNMLCALNLDEPCTTFRPAERNLAPERQLAFIFRTERTPRGLRLPAAQLSLSLAAGTPGASAGLESDACA